MEEELARQDGAYQDEHSGQQNIGTSGVSTLPAYHGRIGS